MPALQLLQSCRQDARHRCAHTPRTPHHTRPRLRHAQVGVIADEHAREVETLVEELLPLLQAELSRSSSASARQAAQRLRAGDVADQLHAYSRSIAAAVPDKAMAMAELRWRNGALLRLAATPLHVSWLARAGVPYEVIVAAASGTSGAAS
jgi:hypothetical protein